MMLAGLPVAADATADLAEIVRAADAADLADRLDGYPTNIGRLTRSTPCACGHDEGGARPPSSRWSAASRPS